MQHWELIQFEGPVRRLQCHMYRELLLSVKEWHKYSSTLRGSATYPPLHGIPHCATCTYTFVPKCILLSSLVHAQQETCWHTWRLCPRCVDLVSQKVPWSLLLPRKFGAVGGPIRLPQSPGCRSAMKTLTHGLYVIFGLPFQFSEGLPCITNQTVNISNSSRTHSVWDGLPAHLFKLSDELQYRQSRSQTKIINLCKHNGQFWFVSAAQNQGTNTLNPECHKLFHDLFI